MEHLKGPSSLCSMRFPLGVSNVRILFFIKIIKYTCFVHFMSVEDIKYRI